MRARWRLLKATGGVAAQPEPESCPRPRAASPGAGARGWGQGTGAEQGAAAPRAAVAQKYRVRPAGGG